MTIIHLITGLGGGGAEHMVLELAKSAKEQSLKTIVVSISNENKIEQKFKNAQLEYYFLNINSISNIPSGLKKLKQAIGNQTRPVIHCHMFHALVIAVIYNFLNSSIPILFTLHNNNIGQMYRRVILFLLKPFRKKDIIFSINSKKWYLKNSAVVQNGVDFESFKITTDRNYNNIIPFKFLFLGSLSEQKNPLYLIKLVKQLLIEGASNFVIDVVGDGDLREELQTAIEDNKIQDYIILNGFLNNIKQVLAESHCLIMPSLWEGMPISIIEASATRLPIIVTPVGSIPDFLNSSNAYVSDLNHFSESMLSVLRDYKSALIKSNKLYEEINSVFNIENVFNKHLDLYNSIVRT